MKRLIDIVIATYNLPEFFTPCVNSIVKTGILEDYARLIVVNNGRQPIAEQLTPLGDRALVLTPGENLGWEGALKLACEHSDAPFIVFQNDDTFLPYPSKLFYQNLLTPFSDSTVGAVGPITTTATGIQSIYHPETPEFIREVSYLIFFCVMVRRSALDAVGGIDTTLPGGDDFDLSLRLMKAGYHLVVNPNAFLIHHGFQTGTRLNGDHTKIGGWNSPEMIDRTAHALIRKHGFKAYLNQLRGMSLETAVPPGDSEGDLVRSFIQGEKIVELGCGHKKTVKTAIGVDRISAGAPIPHLRGEVSVADITADASLPLPFEPESVDCLIARHIFEHCIDSVQVLRQWKQVLKPGGRLIIAVPDECVTSGIPANPEHCHAFDTLSLKHLAELVGFQTVEIKSSGNGVSLVACFENPATENVFGGSSEIQFNGANYG